MKESASLRFLYNTAPGRKILKLLVQPSVSEAAAHYLSSPASCWLINYYIKKHNINLDNCERQKFSSFNDFFKRKKLISIQKNDNAIISPCDGFLSVYHITKNLYMNIKHSQYTIASLLHDNNLASEFSDGICCVFRLEPQHYHRYLYAVSGDIKKSASINGVLHCVRPIACQKYPVYVQNSRQYTIIKNPILGSVVQMEIGALLVGKIHNHSSVPYVECGMEKGYFEYGGSTIILIFKKNSILLSSEFAGIADSETEIPVSVGQIFATTKNADN